MVQQALAQEGCMQGSGKDTVDGAAATVAVAALPPLRAPSSTKNDAPSRTRAPVADSSPSPGTAPDPDPDPDPDPAPAPAWSVESPAPATTKDGDHFPSAISARKPSTPPKAAAAAPAGHPPRVNATFEMDEVPAPSEQALTAASAAAKVASTPARIFAPAAVDSVDATPPPHQQAPPHPRAV